MSDEQLQGAQPGVGQANDGQQQQQGLPEPILMQPGMMITPMLAPGQQVRCQACPPQTKKAVIMWAVGAAGLGGLLGFLLGRFVKR